MKVKAEIEVMLLQAQDASGGQHATRRWGRGAVRRMIPEPREGPPLPAPSSRTSGLQNRETVNASVVLCIGSPPASLCWNGRGHLHPGLRSLICRHV